MRRVLFPVVAVFTVFFSINLFAQAGDGFDIEKLLRGDANNNGVVAVSDATYINSYLYSGGSAPPCMDAADANDDGSVDVTDAIYILNYLQQGGPAPPAPFPVCGKDTTSDSLHCAQTHCS